MSKKETILSPIAVFAYNRFEMFKRTMAALKKCHLAEQSEVYIFSDGGRDENDEGPIENIRHFAENISGFKELNLRFAKKNKGLASSIIGGVTEVLEVHGSVIVLEDDLLPSTNFLSFMNQALREYEKNQKVVSVSGYTGNIKIPEDYIHDSYFTRRMSSWGWGTWQDRWASIDWTVSDYHSFRNDKNKKKEFNRMGSDLSSMLAKQMNGKIDSWAIRFCYHQYKHGLYSLFPVVSKIENIGFGENATHTKKMGARFETAIDNSNKTDFKFDRHVVLNEQLIDQYVKKFSLQTRIFHRIKSLFGK